MPFHAKEEETLDPDGLVKLQRQRLSQMLRDVLAGNAFYRRKFAGIAFDPRSDPLDRLPYTTRQEIQQDQLDHPPYGSDLTYDLKRYSRLHQTSGSSGVPLRWLDTPETWDRWKHYWGIIYRAAGLTSEDRLIFPFSFGPFIGFWSAFESAVALGNLALPAGGMTTTARLRYMLDNNVTFVCCTPTYALRMAEVAQTEGIDLKSSSVRGLIVAGEPGGSIAATRSQIETSFGARVFDHCGMTEMGPWGFECLEARGGMHVLETDFIAEVVDRDTGRPVPDSEPGELVLTNLGRVGSPLIRYRTGDQVRLTRNRCTCGRWFAWAEGGILGRIDDMIVIRGNNVFPSAVEGIVREFDEIAEFQLVLDRQAAMPQLRIVIELRDEGASSVEGSKRVAGLTDRLARAVRDRLHFSPEIAIAKPGSLPRFEMKARRVVRLGKNAPD